MKRLAGLISIAILATVLIMMIQTASVGAKVEEPPSFTVEIVDYPSTVQPGSSYNIRVRITRPAGMALPVTDEKWEVRIYFYDELNCYNDGKWTTIRGSTLYDGWWNARIWNESWTAAMDDTREFTITVKVVNYPRPSEDIQRGMSEIPVGGSVKLKAKLRLRGMTVNPDNTFTYNGVTYRIGSLPIELSDAGYYQIDYDTVKSGIAVSAAPGFAIPLVVVIPVVVLLVVVAVVVVVLKKRGGAEVPPPPPPPPSL